MISAGYLQRKRSVPPLDTNYKVATDAFCSDFLIYEVMVFSVFSGLHYFLIFANYADLIMAR